MSGVEVSRLKLRQLALLQAVDRHRSLSRVAAEMRVSQPAITKALHEAKDCVRQHAVRAHISRADSHRGR